jgi:hypothetical protein
MATPQEHLRETLAKINPKAAQLFDEHQAKHKDLVKKIQQENAEEAKKESDKTKGAL